ncbi:phosphatase PAP2 family protein [candidate division KSB1 bacterium]|nr:phosphatase PAP2 family protein [candidate division KSB1 bacterium]
MDFLQQIDTSLFFWINQGWQNPIFDWLMPFVTRKENGFPLWIVVYILLLWKGGTKGRIAALLIIPVIVFSDQLSASVFKPLFQRTRPCVALEDVQMLTGLKTSFSFPSSHAANIFAAASFFAIFYPQGRWFYWTLASLVGLSRIYVGVHYPFDVIAGAVLGVLCTLFVIGAYRLIEKTIARSRGRPAQPVV